MSIWITAQQLPRDLDNNLKCWLVDCYSISQSIKALGLNFTLKLKSSGLKAPISDEKDTLNTEQNCHIREIYCLGNDRKISFGRTCIPKKTMNNQLNNLGNQPIGETLLYNNPDVSRSDFEYVKLSKNNEYLPNFSGWARRSIFTIDQNSLLITELFLDNLPDITTIKK